MVTANLPLLTADDVTKIERLAQRIRSVEGHIEAVGRDLRLAVTALSAAVENLETDLYDVRIALEQIAIERDI